MTKFNYFGYSFAKQRMGLLLSKEPILTTWTHDIASTEIIPESLEWRYQADCLEIIHLVRIQNYLQNYYFLENFAYALNGCFLVCLWNQSAHWSAIFTETDLTLFFLMSPFDQRFSDVFRGIKREHWEEKG